MASNNLSVSHVSEEHLAYVVCEWLAGKQREALSAGDAELGEDLSAGLDVLQAAFAVDVHSNPQQQSNWSLALRGTTLKDVVSLGLSGRENLVSAVEQLKQKQGTGKQGANTSAAPKHANATEEKFSDYLRVVASRGFFGECAPGSDEYESRYAKARAKFLEKHSPGRDHAAPASAASPAAAASASAPSSSSGAARTFAQPSAANAASAVALKEKGNAALSAGDLDQAIEFYTEAIALDETNPVYFSNRAAAFSKLEQHDKVIEDCHEALARDPKYAKAFSRLGLAYFSKGDFKKSVDAYERAIELEPSNTTFHSSLSAAKAKVAKSTANTPRPGAAGMPDLGGLGGLADLARQAQQNPEIAAMMRDAQSSGQMPDLNSPNIAAMAQQAMQNPDFMNMAQQLMSDPQMMQQMMGMMGGMGGGGGLDPAMLQQMMSGLGGMGQR